VRRETVIGGFLAAVVACLCPSDLGEKAGKLEPLSSAEASAPKNGRHHAGFREGRFRERSERRVYDYDTDLNPPPYLSPELVLVSPPEVARAAREALEPRFYDDAAPPLRKAQPPLAPVLAPARPPSTARRRIIPVLLPAGAAALLAAGFFAGRQVSGERASSAPATTPAPSVLGESTAKTAAASTRARPARPPLPVVSWKPRPGIRRYRFDLVTGRVAILTIVTDEPRAQLPLSWPNAGRRRRLAPGRYAWTVRAAAGASRVIARGTVTIPKPSRS
jgi:hypothetical protein